MRLIYRELGDREEGFTLIELLVVMIIIGILAAIAIPVFLSQRTKAKDTSAKADVSTIGKEIATYYVDQTAPPTLSNTTSPGRYTLNGNDIGAVSSGNTITEQHFTDSSNWCLGVTNNAPGATEWHYSAKNGLVSGACAGGADY